MDGRQERRAAGIQRVPVRSLVELCGLDPRVAPAFEAEGIDVSGRGLHVRTGFLPEVGTPLVCRLEERGREIIAEGLVAWTRQGQQGGEFGLMFTALDQGSVGVLRELTGLEVEDAADGDDGDEAGAPEPPARAAEPPPAPPRNEPGARVRLHIEGLGAPMKAQVRSGGRSRVKVGSTLEMLRVGRQLEIENLERKARRAACVDAVEVLIDPQTGIPQLVVALHYADVEDVTPEPTVIDEERAGSGAVRGHERSVHPPRPVADVQGDDDADDDAAPYDEDDELAAEDEIGEEANHFQGRLSVAAQQAGELMRRTGAAVADVGGRAAVGLARLAKESRARMAQGRASARVAAPRRTTAPPPAGSLNVEGRRLRPQSARAAPAAEPEASAADPLARQVQRVATGKLGRRLAIGGGLLVTAVSLGAYATGGIGAGDRDVEAPQPTALAAAPAPAPLEGAAVAAPPSVPAKLSEQPAQTGDGIVANVPLFGPTPMATMEPAPLGPAPAVDSEVIPVAKAVPVADETFEQPVVKGTDSWGRGRVHLPTIHRLRLDQPGSTIQGEPSATGFAVVLPGVKVMEEGGGIAKRDDRIVKVAVDNGPAGGKVTFRFRGEVPPYRVRLRKDYVEFLVSAPK